MTIQRCQEFGRENIASILIILKIYSNNYIIFK